MDTTCTLSHCAGWLHVSAMLTWLLHGDGLLTGVAGCPAGFAAIVELVRPLAWLV